MYFRSIAQWSKTLFLTVSAPSTFVSQLNEPQARNDAEALGRNCRHLTHQQDLQGILVIRISTLMFLLLRCGRRHSTVRQG